jgi:hypothetical protein
MTLRPSGARMPMVLAVAAWRGVVRAPSLAGSVYALPTYWPGYGCTVGTRKCD